MHHEQEKPQPVSSGERLHFLDIARGFAMLGIIIVNYFLMADSANGLTVPAKDLWHRMVHWFAEGKFYTMFSFLFGAGFMLFMERAERRSIRPRKLFARRLTILLLFGLLHITLIWVGDILALYAITGYLLLAFYKRRPKTLLVWAIAMMSLFSLLPFLSLLLLASVDPSSGGDEADNMLLTSHSLDLSYLQSIGERWADMGTIAIIAPIMMFSVLSMFLLGMYFVQKGLFSGMEAKKRVWNRIWAFSATGFAITQAGFIAGTVLDTAEMTTVHEAYAYLGQTLGGLAGSLFYMSTLAMLYLHVPKLRKLLMMLGRVGRMSLTCYILHAITGTFLFLGYGFGVAEGIHPAGVLAICCGVYAVLLAVSSWWLKRASYGPLERLWRRLTYGGVRRTE